MDFYISEFHKNMGTCEVQDYAVFIRKHTGFARFNPFASADQVVIYLTDRGCFFCRIQGMGEFTQPVPLDRSEQQISADGAQLHEDTKQYAFVRKCKTGTYASRATFAAAVRREAR